MTAPNESRDTTGEGTEGGRPNASGVVTGGPAGGPAAPAGSLTFVGTATTVMTLGPFTLLTDPNFLRRGQRAYLGRGLWTKRLTDPAMGIAQLPPLDAVVLSHLHGDHWDRVARQQLSKSVPLLTTRHAARRLGPRGFPADGMDTWEQRELRKDGQELRVIAVPAVHARGVLGRLLPPVMGSVIEHHVDGRLARRIYVSGDTLTGDHVDAIAERFPDIDAAVVHLGGTRVLTSTVTMDAAQGVDFLKRITATTAIPIHYDDYRIFRSSLSEFLAEADAAGLAGQVTEVRRGTTVELPGRSAG